MTLVREPERFGRYLLFDALAAGGMATVYLGRLTGAAGFERTVAIKRMRPEIASPEHREMFLDEARLAARVVHANVVPTLDAEEIGGELLVVMEYVAGETLAALLVADRKRIRAPIPIALAIAVHVLLGLQAAHDARHDDGRPLELVHRDVSGGNILVGIDGVARVSDFGVARAAIRSHKTRTGLVKGKIAYMAPEVLRGAVATPRVDTYALGVVLWEALAGRRLFAGENVAAVTERVLLGCAHPPSHYAPDVPDDVDEVVMRALSSSPDDRFSSAREMARAIESSAPVATVHEVAEWVAERAAHALAERADLVRRVEAYVMPTPAPRESPSVEPREETATEGPRHSRRSIPFAVAGAVLGVVAIAAVSAPRSATRSAGPATTIVTTAADPTAVPPSQSATAGSVATPALSSETPSIKPARAHPSAAARGATPPRPGCSPPFFRDASGSIRWKTECL